LRMVKNPGLLALLNVAGIELGAAPSARQVGFQIGPRINAAGRMDTASDVVELFTTLDVRRAQEIAGKLDGLNKDRRETEDGIRQAILEQCLAQPVTDGDTALVFAGEGWHRGVVGIVASRVVAKYHRPVFVLGIENDVAIGSGRSIRQFHLLEALESMPELFTKFGGHTQAAGLTIPSHRVDEFRARFREYASTRLTRADFEPEIEIDSEIELREITDRNIGELLNLAPFGMGNAPPVFVLRGVTVAHAELKKDKHLFARFEHQGKTIRAKTWDVVDKWADRWADKGSAPGAWPTGLQPGSCVDIVLQFEEDAYSAARGYAPWQAMLLDFRASASASDKPGCQASEAAAS
jgi:single-stranded-DNA-specific exonuclease